MPNEAPVRPSPEDVAAKAKFDQQQLVARLYRSHGASFSDSPNTVLPTRPVKTSRATRLTTRPARNVNIFNKLHRQLPEIDPNGDDEDLSPGREVVMAVSKSKRLRLLNRHADAEKVKERELQVEVPTNLKALLGSKVSLSTSVYKHNRATIMAGGDIGPTFSFTGQLPTSKFVLKDVQDFSTGKDKAQGTVVKASKTSGPVDTMASDQQVVSGKRRKTREDVKDNKVEYEKYLRSPFSFIDKVIESPYTEEFVYLNPMGPYDLQIVKHNLIDPNNYYTMSRAGVTQFYQTETDFTSLDQWEREYFLYTKMMGIPFFKKFRMWKAFYFWKKLIRRTKTAHCRKFLEENLYILNEYLRGSLIQLREHCYSASNWTLFKVDPKNTLTLIEFQAQQEQQKEIVMRLLYKLNQDVRKIVLDACEVDLREFLISNGFRRSKDDAQVDELNQDDGDYHQKISHAEKAAIRTKCRKLTKYIRLADYFVIDTLVTLSMDRTEDVLKYVERRSELQLKAQAQAQAALLEEKKVDEKDMLRRPGKDKKIVEKPLFSVELRLDFNDDLKFTPELEEFQVSLEQAIDSAIKKIMTPKRLLMDPDFYVYTQQNVEEGDDDQSVEFKLEAMVLQDPNFVDIKHSIKQGLTKAFEAAFDYATGFTKYSDVYVQNNATDIQSFAESSIDDFSLLIAKYQAQIEEFVAMPESKAVGIIDVLSLGLKNTLLPSPTQCLQQSQQLLPAVAHEKCTALLTELKESTAQFKVPDTVEEFVKIKNFLSECQENLEVLEKRYQFVAELYRLMRDPDNSIKIPESDKANLEKLEDIRKRFARAMAATTDNLDTHTDRFVTELREKIPLLQEKISEVEGELQEPMIANTKANVKTVIEYLQGCDENLESLEQRAEKYQYYQEVLSVEVTPYEGLRERRADMNIKLQLWNNLQKWDKYSKEWTALPFDQINAEQIAEQVKGFSKFATKASQVLQGNEVVTILKDKVNDFKNTLPIVQHLRNPKLIQRHWDEINGLLNHTMATEKDTLGTLIDLNAMEHTNSIAIISVKAGQEALLEETLANIDAQWADLAFPVKSHKGAKDVYVLGSLEDVITTLDESLVNVNTILGSRYVDPIKEQVQEWNRKLILFQETLDEWITCQRSWMYLETIFSGGDIARQLPEETQMFNSVDKGWKEIMRRVNDTPTAIVAGTYSGTKEKLASYNETLDQIQKQLEAYLETKRQLFPRFYFLSNDELILILSESKNVNAVQPHLRKCFDNLVRIEFEDKDIKNMFSAEGECVPLGMNLKARGSVEAWLGALEGDMVKSLRRYLKKGVADYETTPRREWVLTQFAQVVMTASQIAWCRGCELALTDDNVPKALDDWYAITGVQQVSELVAVVRGNLSKIDRKKIVALITTDVHNRDTVDKLRDNTVDSTSDFIWQQQLRFYWDTDEDDCIVRQSNARMLYGYEYMGVTSRLVITPLTDRCWMTITGALHLRFGAAPAGPAGTGKTESTKDLAKAIGCYCVVFNCSDQINYMTMAKLFSGLAQAGAWTCLDEFNRIDIEVLSVVAQQLLIIRTALVEKKTEFEFSGSTITLRGVFGVMITMNPGYAGRTELPDNLKVLFRPVSMMIPDYALIAEIMLFAEGFDTAQVLSKKMTKLYKLSSEQLSQQDHYDFGMRAVKSVLVMAGALKRSETTLSEDVVLIRAMKEANIPKFLSVDIPLFEAIVQDLFPGVEIPATEYGELEIYVKQGCEQLGLQTVAKFVLKVIQLFDTFNVRFGVMIVGPTGAGKSACYNTLQKSMTNLREADNADQRYQVVHTHVLNPKCVTMGELYGDVNALTQEWTDGLASTIMREAIQDDSEDRHWVVFDGPVDALWIENMNTVLDDNMTLCLVNGERIKLKVELRMLFEVQDLSVASPATVSRCGMVYMTPSDLGVLPYVKSWLPRLHPKTTQFHRDHLYSLFESKLIAGIRWLRENGKEPIPTVDIQVTASLCFLFEALWTEEHGVLFDEEEKLAQLSLDYLFAFCFGWAIGGSLNEAGQKLFSKWIPEQFDTIRVPSVCFNNFVNIGEEKGWIHWDTKVPGFDFNPSTPYSQLVVPTMDTIKYSWLLETLLEVQRSVFFTGVSGVGKTVVIMDMFEQTKDTKGIVPVTIGFSAQTNARKTQENIEAKLVKLRKTQLGAPAGKKVVIFIDDLNMPETEEYGAQPPVELLRQFQDFKGFYDRSKLFWKQIVDTTIIAAAAPPGGGRSPTTPRFIRHFNVMCLPEPSEKVMKKIFGSILDGFLRAFKTPVQNCKDAIVASTLEIYSSITAELLPTPMKSHYTFNLRDISKVFQGILMITPQNCATSETITRLWIHEAMRCFHDRLIDDIDARWFTDKCVQLLQRQFKLSWTHEQLFVKGTLMFGNFFKPGLSDDYMERPVTVNIDRIMSEYMDEYNANSGNTMNLVFFDDAIRHISRIARILSQPRGNAMLVGVGGSGKQSLTRLASSMADFECLTIELTRGYNYADFQEHLKKLMIIAGVEGKNVVFLFNENQIVQERFLEDVNNILNSGEVPNLFPDDELLKVIDDLTPVVRDMGLPATRAVVYATFVQRVRDNLHIVLCMSPVGSAFRVRCRQFPSLINCTTIDWFQKWPEQALASVATSFLAKVSLESEDHRKALGEACVTVHMTMDESCDQFWEELRRKVYTTPKSYLDMISLYLQMLEAKREELGIKRQRLVVGLNKLEETTTVVADLKETLTELKPVLEKKSKETDVLLEQVNIDTEKADKVKEVVSKEAAKVEIQQKEVAEIKEEAQRELDVAMPAYEKAMKQLEKLKKSDISEVKGMGSPPEGVVKTMEAVCILFGVKADWESAKKNILSRINLLGDLKDYDKDNIKESTIKKLQKYVNDENLKEEKMLKISVAAASLMVWVNAMCIYSKVAKEVGPKKERVAKMNQLLEEANTKLRGKQDELKKVIDQVAALQAKCDEAVNEKNTLNSKLAQTEGRMTRANKLTSGLSSEATRWLADSEKLGEDIKLLVGDVFLAAACVSYYGPFTGEYRSNLVSTWTKLCKEKNIPASDDPTLRGTFGEDVVIRQWNINGLPSDDVSVNSGILVEYGSRYPLMIDPQEQAKKWVKNQYKKQKLATSRFARGDFGQVLERCLSNGFPILIEDVGEEIDSSIDPILTKQIFESGGRKVIRMGDKEVEFDPAFKLFITTKMPNPHYMPEVCIKVTIINFTVTMSGLEDQLLGEVIKKERADVEEKKNKLVVKMADDRAQLSELESKILKLLSESKGNILDDQVLIETLAESKSTSNIINERVAQSVETQKKITTIREGYRTVAERGSILYFVIADLGNVDPMYQYSLTFFMKLFNICLNNSEPSDDLETRLKILMEYTTQYMYFNICRGLFEIHKMMYAFIISCKILMAAGDVEESQFRLLLKPSAGLKASEDSENPAPETISDLCWQFCGFVEESVPVFEGLRDDIISNVEPWKAYVLDNTPHEAELPGKWANLTNFQKLIVLKMFRDEKILFACSNFVRDSLGKHFVEPQNTALADVHKDTDNKTPIIFVLSVGADPTSLLLRFAEEIKYSDKLDYISLGQGQEENAKNLVREGKRTGRWVLLQNCHLAKSFMPQLETVVDAFEDDPDMHEDFRLWLTSMPVSYFPVSVLQKGVKLTNEPPKGLRANLLRSFNTVIRPEEFDVHSKPQPFKKLLFGLCFFHAIIQERKKFGPLGWNIMYEFNDSDLETSIQVLQMFLEEQDQIPWDALRYVCGHINYGGRVTDDWDRRCLMSILEKYFTPSILAEYSFSPSGIYFAPEEGPLGSYQAYIKTLPKEVDPEVFGMHENANISFQRSETQALLSTVLSLQPRDTGGGEGAKSPDEVVSEMASEMLEKMPAPTKFKKNHGEVQEEEEEIIGEVEEEVVTDSLSIVLMQEIDRFNRLISKCSTTLRDLCRAITGEIVMSADLDAMYTSLLNNQVPKLWEAVSYPSLKPLAPWIEDFYKRIEFLNLWNDKGAPVSFWMSGMFFPQGFMTAVLQVHARKYQLPIDRLSFKFKVLTVYSREDIDSAPEDGVFVDGLFMDGARWDNERCVIADSHLGELFSTVPAIHFIPTNEAQQDPADYECPVYKTSVRAGILSTTGQSTNFVLPVYLPSNRHRDYWIQKGAAFLCALDY